MGDEIFPEEQLFRLCQATTINKELLLKFLQDKMMIHGDIERIVSWTHVPYVDSLVSNIVTWFADRSRL